LCRHYREFYAASKALPILAGHTYNVQTYFHRQKIIMTIQLPVDINDIKGFMANDEAEALYNYALSASTKGPVLEVGSYCGKSTIYLGCAAQKNGSVVFAVDHHRGSEEHQFGEEYHDNELYDASIQLMDTFREFRKNMRAANLEDTVIPVVSSSKIAARFWHTPLSMVFIDGGHSFVAAEADYRSWAVHVQIGGILAIHDLFPDPAKGGQAPITIYRLALASGLFEELEIVNTLGILRRIQ
jgi:predicted O-methyltransferase YrrM